MMPPQVAQIRREMCGRAGCQHEPEFFADPCAACSVSGWGKHSQNCSDEPRLGLGDLVERAVKPIATLLGLPCYDESGKLKPESGCADRRDKLNKLPVRFKKKP